MGTLSISYNGTAITSESRTSYPTVSYNGSQIIGGFSGTKTLNTANKMMKGNLVIGGKTLNTANKMMKGNVVATYTPSLGSTQNGTAFSTSSYMQGFSIHMTARCANNIASSYALFVMDHQNTSMQDVHAYNSSGTRSAPTNTQYPIYSYRYYPIVGSIGSYAVVGWYWETMETWNTSLTRGTIAPGLGIIWDNGMTTASTSSYAYFVKNNRVFALNASLTVSLDINSSIYSTLHSSYTCNCSPIPVNNTYAVFMGGTSSWNASTPLNRGFYFTNSLTHAGIEIDTAIAGGRGYSVGSGAILHRNNGSTQVYTYTSNLSRSTTTGSSFTPTGTSVVGCTIPNAYALICSPNGNNHNVDTYNTSFTRGLAGTISDTFNQGEMATAGSTAVLMRHSGTTGNSQKATSNSWSYS